VSIFVLLSAAAIVIGLFFDCRECSGFVVLGALGVLASIWIALRTYRRGSEDLELRIDRDGFQVEGTRIPWAAVTSIRWRQGRGEEGNPRECIELQVRNAGPYRAPRDRKVFLTHGEYDVRANLLIEMLETAALPRRIPVLAIEPPPAAPARRPPETSQAFPQTSRPQSHGPTPTERDIRALETRGRELPRRSFRGYRRDEVDAFVGEVLEGAHGLLRENEGLRAGISPSQLSSPPSARPTPSDVQDRRFRLARFGGYQLRTIDNYLDDLTDLIEALTGENESLRATADPDDGRTDR
jgi:DivIVA domain-containing protein